MASSFKCEICGNKYSKDYMLTRHIKNKHQDSVELPLNFKCTYCDRRYEKNFILRRHMKTMHKGSLKEDDFRSNLCCPLCQNTLPRYSDFFQHCCDEHGIEIKSEKIEFSNENEFLIWKNNEEKSTKTYFIRNTGPTKRVSKNMNKLIYLFCNRSGFYKRRIDDNNRKREIKAQGSRKINGFCPCGMIVKYYNDGKVSVDYRSTHIGHDLELIHIPLADDEKQKIASKLSDQVGYDDILGSVRSIVEEQDLDRTHLLTKQDLYNIETQFGLRDHTNRKSIDSFSINAWVEEEANSDSNCILFYKPEYETSQLSTFKEEDFALGFMTKAQEEILKMYGNHCICFDCTHRSDSHAFEVLTLMVSDEMGQGYPCAYFICSRIDSEAIGAFLSAIKSRIGVVEASVFMSDIPDAYFGAWVAEMGPVKISLYCTWHVDRAWKKNLTRIKCKEKQADAYKTLITLLEEQDIDIFSGMLNQVVEFLCNDEETKDFGNYFVDQYAGCSEKWAYCYRKTYGLESTTNLERIHTTIKQLYLRGKRNERLDRTIKAILQLTEQKFMNNSVLRAEREKAINVKKLRIRHRRALNIKTCLIIETGDNCWEVASYKLNMQPHTVKLVKLNCVCRLVCQKCSACVHKYSCTCLDSRVNLNMCKHIHLLCLKLKAEDENYSNDSFDTELSSHSNEREGSDEQNFTLKEVCSTGKDIRFKVLKAQLLENFTKTINGFTSMEELNLGEQSLKMLETELKSKDTELPKAQPNEDLQINTERSSPQRKRPRVIIPKQLKTTGEEDVLLQFLLLPNDPTPGTSSNSPTFDEIFE